MTEENTNEVTESTESTKEKVVTKKKVNKVTKDSKIKVIAESNPKREGSKAYDRFEGYFKLGDDATVADALDAGLTMGDIHYDFIHGNIEVDGAEIEEYTPQPRGTRKPKDESSEEASDESTEEASDESTEEASEEGF